MLPTNARERGAWRSFKGRKEVTIYPKEAHKIRVRWLLLAQNTSLPTCCFVGVLIQLFVQQLHPVFSVTKLQMIICHAQHSLVGRSTIGVNLLNATLKIVKHMQKIKKLTMIFYYGSNATYIKIYRYGYLIIRDAFYETALWALPVWVLLSFYSCQHPGILVWLSTSYKQNRLHASAKFVQGNATRVKLLTIRARGNVLARSWVDSCSRTYEQKNMQPTSSKYENVNLTR